MAEDLKARVLEIAGIAQACPEPFQDKAFELLLADYLASRSGRGLRHETEEEVEQVEEEAGLDQAAASDLTQADLHVKTKRFLERFGLTLDDLNQIFYKQGSEILPLYDDLGTTRMAEGQIRIALLQALRAGIHSGEFEFNGEDVRAESQLRKCYDSSNFTGNFKTNASYFDGFERYDKKKPRIKLSDTGRKALAELIRELA